MSGFSAVELDRLPFPGVIRQVDFEVNFSELLQEFRDRAPEFDALVESDPVFKLIEVAAYYKTIVQQSVNDAARAVMPAYAVGSDLDNIAAIYGVERHVIDPGDDSAIPPILPVLEADGDLRRRMFLAFEGLSVAGPQGAYIFHALGANADVADASATSLEPGQVTVTVLSRYNDGSAPAELVDAVDAALNHEDVRPLTDQVFVQSAEIIPYTIDARLSVLPGPDSDVVRSAAISAVEEYASSQRRLGQTVSRSGIFAALHQSGVQSVVLVSPAVDITASPAQAPHCSAISVVVGL